VGGGGGYGQWCQVHGEVLIGDDRVEVAATGHREHGWGSAPRAWRVAVPPWWVSEGDVGAVLHTEWGADGLPTRAVFGEEVVLTPQRWSPVAVPGVRVVHALCDGPAWGWVSWCGPR
jgi:hypothetical protein